MKTQNEEQKDFQLALLKNFHKQFAENQNHHQSLVIKFLAGLVILLVTFLYATVFQKSYLVANNFVEEKQFSELIITKAKFIISDDLYFYFAFFICLILSVCFIYIVQAAYSFRRDQSIVAKIRHEAGGACEQIFGSYGQLSKKCFWPPDLFIIILLLISFFYLGVSIYVLFLSSISSSLTCERGIFLIPIFIMLIAYIRYTDKYKRLL